MDEKLNLLIVDDDKMAGQLLAKRLTKLNFFCDFASNGNECFKYIKEKKYDCILLDIVMPDISGMEVLKKIREEQNNFELPVIMVTAKDEVSDIVEALRLGANDYLTKPVNMEIAVARIVTQSKIKKLVGENLRSRQVSTINTMVTTLNHEINNPLAIAVGNLSLSKDKIVPARIEKALAALKRITEIVKKIDRVTKGDMEEVQYSSEVNMFNIHDEEKESTDK